MDKYRHPRSLAINRSLLCYFFPFKNTFVYFRLMSEPYDVFANEKHAVGQPCRHAHVVNRRPAASWLDQSLLAGEATTQRASSVTQESFVLVVVRFASRLVSSRTSTR